jgi:hypothetical protein
MRLVYAMNVAADATAARAGALETHSNGVM